MLYGFQGLPLGTILLCSAALGQQTTTWDDQVWTIPIRSFTKNTEVATITNPPYIYSLPSGAISQSLFPLTSSPPFSVTLPYTLKCTNDTCAPESTSSRHSTSSSLSITSQFSRTSSSTPVSSPSTKLSTSTSGSISTTFSTSTTPYTPTSVPTSSDIPWGPLIPPPPKTHDPSDTTWCQYCNVDVDSTTTRIYPTSTLDPNSTVAWLNTTAPPTITSKPTLTSSSPDPACTQGKKGCDSNTDTRKTYTPVDDSTSTCEYGAKGCDAEPTDICKEGMKGCGPSSTTTSSTTSTDCDITLFDGMVSTAFVLVPNHSTTTLTVIANMSTTFSQLPEFTPPSFCYPPGDDGTTRGAVPAQTTSYGLAPPPVSSTTSSPISFPGCSAKTCTVAAGAPITVKPADQPVTTVFVTSKNPVTVFTTEKTPGFPGGGKTDKQTVNPITSTDIPWGPLTPPPPKTAIDATTIPLDQLPSPILGPITPSTTKVGGVTVIVGPTQVIVGTHTIVNGHSTKITENGQTFTVNPTQVIGPSGVISIPTRPGGVFIPTPTVIAGVPVQLGPSNVVVGGTTFSIGKGATPTTVVVDGQTISIGPGGLGFAQTTVAPPVLPTKVIIVDGGVIQAIGSTALVIEGSTIFYGPGSTPQTTVFHGATITVGPSGISFGTTTLGGSDHPSGTQYGIAGGISITEIGSTVAIVDGTTFIVGPGATSTTAVVNGKTITAGEGGLTIEGGTTLSSPFNPVTEVITAGGITFTKIGSTLVDIGGTTFTIGPGAATTTDVYNGQTISLGPGGVGFTTTTVPATSAQPTATHTSKKNGAGILRPYIGVLGICIAFGVRYNI